MSEPIKYAEHGVVSWVEYQKAIEERDEARAVAHYAYWHLPTFVTYLPTGKYWHEERYAWLKEVPDP